MQCGLPSSVLGRDVETLGTSRKVVALTFDAGSSNAGVTSILATLRDTGTPASFFMTGDFANDYPTSASRIAAAHPIGNHSMTHPYFTQLSDAQIATELTKARSAIIAATGDDPRPWFRFPFGDVNSRTVTTVNRQCYVPFRWTVDSLGWQGTSGGMSRDKVISRVVNGVAPGGIVLMHVGANPDDGTTLDADALPAIISGLEARGYTFTTLDAVVSSDLG